MLYVPDSSIRPSIISNSFLRYEEKLLMFVQSVASSSE